jgi:hypothetical protein
MNDIALNSTNSLLDKQRSLTDRHSTTISASHAHKIMTELDLINVLPATAKKHIESMVKMRQSYFKAKPISTPAIAHGKANELPAIALLEQRHGIKLFNTGENQKAWFYGDFVSALPDGNDVDNVPYDVKCLSTENHLIACCWTEKELMQNDRVKYCQSQCQMLCTGAETGFMVFYDPRVETDLQLHLIEIKKSVEWQEQFLIRVELAKAYYAQLLTSPVSKKLAIPVIQLNTDLVKHCIYEVDDKGNYVTRNRTNAVEETKKWLDSEFATQIDFNVVYDVSNPHDIKICEDVCKRIRAFKTPLTNATLALADNAKKVKDTEVGVRQAIIATIDGYAERVIKPVKEFKDEQKRIAQEKQDAIDAENKRLAEVKAAKEAHDSKVAGEISALRNFPKQCEKYASVALEAEIKQIKSLVFKADFFGERLAEANDAKDVVIMKLENMLKTAIFVENQRAEQVENKRIAEVNVFFSRINSVVGEMQDRSVSELQAKINQIDNTPLNPDVFKGSYYDACTAKADVLTDLNKMLVSQQKVESDFEQYLVDWDLAIVENNSIEVEKQRAVELTQQVINPTVEVVLKPIEPSADFELTPREKALNDLIACFNEYQDVECVLNAIINGEIAHVFFKP